MRRGREGGGSIVSPQPPSHRKRWLTRICIFYPYSLFLPFISWRNPAREGGRWRRGVDKGREVRRGRHRGEEGWNRETDGKEGSDMQKREEFPFFFFLLHFPYIYIECEKMETELPESNRWSQGMLSNTSRHLPERNKKRNCYKNCI